MFYHNLKFLHFLSALPVVTICLSASAISTEIVNVRVVGTNVYTTRALSFSMSPQVLYVVDDMIISDISFISPAEVQKIEFLDDNSASEYGMRGANGVLKITLRKK